MINKILLVICQKHAEVFQILSVFDTRPTEIIFTTGFSVVFLLGISLFFKVGYSSGSLVAKKSFCSLLFKGDLNTIDGVYPLNTDWSLLCDPDSIQAKISCLQTFQFINNPLLKTLNPFILPEYETFRYFLKIFNCGDIQDLDRQMVLYKIPFEWEHEIFLLSKVKSLIIKINDPSVFYHNFYTLQSAINVESIFIERLALRGFEIDPIHRALRPEAYMGYTKPVHNPRAK